MRILGAMSGRIATSLGRDFTKIILFSAYKWVEILFVRGCAAVLGRCISVRNLYTLKHLNHIKFIAFVAQHAVPLGVIVDHKY